jgi:hypothetical protein
MSRPNYAIPIDMFLSVSASIFFGHPARNFAQDAIKFLNSRQPHPLLTGVENLPHDAPFMIVANHHHRENMWIGWIGAMLTEAVYQFRRQNVPLKIVVTDAQRFNFQGKSRVFPLSPWLLGRVAKIWNMIPIPSDPEDSVGHAATLKHVLGLLKAGEPILFFPEGDRGTAFGLVEALPGTGTFIALAARRAQIIPVSFWEEGDLLRGEISPALSITSKEDSVVRAQVMVAIGRRLPESMWGPYHDAIQSDRAR